MSPAHDFRPDILPLGTAGILVRFSLAVSVEATNAVRSFLAAVQDAEIEGLVQTAGSQASVYVEFDPSLTTRSDVVAQLTELLSLKDWAGVKRTEASRCWHVPVAFGGAFGPQLEEAAQLAGRSVEQTIQDICGQLDILTIGFAPGQPFLGLLDEAWNLPRQTALTPSVPAGALVVALRQLVLFNNQSTTGWRWIAQTAFRPFVVDRQEAILLRGGDAVRFHAVAEAEMHELMADNSDGLGGAYCEVLS